MRPPAYDRASFQAEIWKSRVRRFVRVARVVRDLIDSAWFVALGFIVGGMLGALIGAMWDTSLSFWVGMILGALVGGTLGGACAKRMFLSGAEPEVEPMPSEPAPGAPRWPGVEEQFKKILFRLHVLFGLLITPFLLLCYLRVADRFDWQVPFSLPRMALTWGALGSIVVVALLMLLMIRCPKCRGVLWKAAQLYQCPHCGVVLRD